MCWPVRVHVVDPPAYTPPYDHALCSALAAAGAEVTLVTTRFAHGATAVAVGYEVDEAFYRWGPGTRARRAARVLQHVPDMLRYARRARSADVIHFEWLSVQQLDAHLLPRGVPLVLTAHDVLPREPRPGQRSAQRRLYERVDAVVVHSEHGRERLTRELGIEPAKVSVIPHGAFTHLAELPDPAPLPPQLAAIDKPVVLLFGLMRDYKGIDVALEAWHGIEEAELWIVGMPLMDTAPLRASAPPGVRFIERFIGDRELPAFFRRADLVLLPYREIDQSGVLFTALAFGAPMLVSDVGGFPEIAAQGGAAMFPSGDVAALRGELGRLLSDQSARASLAGRAAALASERYGWDGIAEAHLDLYARLLRGAGR